MTHSAMTSLQTGGGGVVLAATLLVLGVLVALCSLLLAPYLCWRGLRRGAARLARVGQREGALPGGPRLPHAPAVIDV